MEWLTAAIDTLTGSTEVTNHRLADVWESVARAMQPPAPAVESAYAGAHAGLAEALRTTGDHITDAMAHEAFELIRIQRTNQALAVTPPIFTVERFPFFRMKGAAPLRQANSVLNYNVEGTTEGPDADVGYRLFPTDVSADTVRELPGADHALAAALCALAGRDGAALRRMFEPSRSKKRRRLDVRFPGQKGLWVHAAVPKAMRTTPVGITTRDEGHFGAELLAKAYGIAQNRGVVPYLDAAKTTVADRAKVAVETVTDNLAFQTEPRLYADDADLLAEINKHQVVVAVTSAISPSTPAYDTAQRCRLITGREQAYAVLGTDTENRIVVHHPLGHRTALRVDDFRRTFVTLLISDLPPALDAPPTPSADQMDHLRAHLDS